MSLRRAIQRSASYLASGLLIGGFLCHYGNVPVASAADWLHVSEPPGVTVKQMAVGNANFIWALDTTGSHWQWTGSAWSKKGCCVESLSATADSALWATNPGNRNAVMRWSADRWNEYFPWGMKQVAAVNTMNAWGIDDAGVLHKYIPASWQKKVGTVLQISAGADGTLMATGSNGAVLRWNGTAWGAVQGSMVQLAVGSAQQIWGLNSLNKVFRLDAGGWALLPGALKNLSAASDGTVWGVNATGLIFKWGGGNWANVPAPAGVTFKQAAVGNASFIWALDSTGSHWQWTGSAWIKRGCCVTGLSATADNALWGTNPGNRNAVLRWIGDRWSEEDHPWGMKQVAAVNSMDAWGIDDAGVLHKLIHASWQKKVGTVQQISAGADGTLMGTTSSGAVLRWNGTAWGTVPGNMVQIAVGSAQQIWGLTLDKVFRLGAGGWAILPGTQKNMSVASDGTAWGVNAAGLISKWVP